jgi:hypothetical protein
MRPEGRVDRHHAAPGDRAALNEKAGKVAWKTIPS